MIFSEMQNDYYVAFQRSNIKLLKKNMFSVKFIEICTSLQVI